MIYKTSIKFAIPIRAYLLSVLFPQRPQKQHKEKHIQAIKIKSGNQHRKVPIMGEEQVVQSKKETKVNQEEHSGNPLVKKSFPLIHVYL